MWSSWQLINVAAISTLILILIRCAAPRTRASVARAPRRQDRRAAPPTFALGMTSEGPSDADVAHATNTTGMRHGMRSSTETRRGRWVSQSAAHLNLEHVGAAGRERLPRRQRVPQLDRARACVRAPQREQHTRACEVFTSSQAILIARLNRSCCVVVGLWAVHNYLIPIILIVVVVCVLLNACSIHRAPGLGRCAKFQSRK